MALSKTYNSKCVLRKTVLHCLLISYKIFTFRNCLNLFVEQRRNFLNKVFAVMFSQFASTVQIFEICVVYLEGNLFRSFADLHDKSRSPEINRKTRIASSTVSSSRVMVTGNFLIGCNDDHWTEVVSSKDGASKFSTSSPSQGKVFTSAVVKSAP